MYPVVTSFGPITIYSLWICIAIGFFTALILLNQLIKNDRQKISFIADHSLALFFGGLILSRITYVLLNLNVFLNSEDGGNHLLQIFYIWDKRLSLWGGIIGIGLTLFYFCRKKNEDFFQWLDILVICTISGLVAGNIGNFFDGRDYGFETNLPWGVIIESSRFAVPIHPVQIYAAIYCAILTVALFNLSKQKISLHGGNIAFTGMAAYSFLRFLEEFLHGDESNIILGLREAQIYCIIAFAVSAGLFYYFNYYPKSISPDSSKNI